MRQHDPSTIHIPRNRASNPPVSECLRRPKLHIAAAEHTVIAWFSLQHMMCLCAGCTDEVPLCQIWEGTVENPISCSYTSAKSMPANFCKAEPGDPKSCGRYNEFVQLDTQVGGLTRSVTICPLGLR